MLWRRRNKKLDKRLNNVVLSAEEARKSYRPKPRRVIIDTSFIDREASLARQEQPASQEQTFDNDAAQHNRAAENAWSGDSAAASQFELQTEAVHGTDEAGTSQICEADGSAQPDDAQSLDVPTSSSCDNAQIAAAQTEMDEAVDRAEGSATAGSATARHQESGEHAVSDTLKDAGDKAANLPLPMQDPDGSLSERAAQEIAELRDALASLRQALEEERAARIASTSGTFGENKHADAFSTPEPLAKIEATAARAQAAEERGLESQTCEAEALQEVLELHDKLEEMQHGRAAVFLEKEKLGATAVPPDLEGAAKSEQLLELKHRQQDVRRLERVAGEKSDIEEANEQKIAALEAKEAAFEAQSNKFEEERHERNEQLEAALQNAERLQRKLSSSEVVAAAAAEARQREKDALLRIEKMQQELQNLETNLKQQTAKLQNERTAKAELENQFGDLEQELNKLKDQLAANEKALADLYNDAETEARLSEDYRQRLKSAHDDAAEMAAERDAAGAKIRVLEEQLAAADRRVVMADGDLKGAQAELAMLRQSRNGESGLSDKLDKLQTELWAAQTDKQNLLRQLSKERSNNEAVAAQLASALENIAVLQEQIAGQQSSLAEISRASQFDVEARLAAEGKAGELEGQLAGLQKEMDAEKSLNAALRLELDKIRKQAAELQSRLSAVGKPTAEASQREAELVGQIGNLENEIAAIQAKAQTARAALEKEIRDLKQALTIAQSLAHSKSSGQATKVDELELRFAADKPVFMKANKAAGAQLKDSDRFANSSSSERKETAKASDRKSYGISTSLAGTIQKEMELTVLGCRVLERSNDGARIDIIPDKFNASIGMPAVGDRLTLTIKTALDNTTVPCEVVWLDGVHCELDFKGPPTTQVEKPKKSFPKAGSPQDAGTIKSGAERRKTVWP